MALAQWLKEFIEGSQPTILMKIINNTQSNHTDYNQLINFSLII